MQITVYFVPVDSGDECKNGGVKVDIPNECKISHTVLWKAKDVFKKGIEALDQYKERALIRLNEEVDRVNTNGAIAEAKFCIPGYDEKYNKIEIERAIVSVLGLTYENISRVNCDRLHKQG